MMDVLLLFFDLHASVIAGFGQLKVRVEQAAGIRHRCRWGHFLRIREAKTRKENMSLAMDR